MRELSMQRFIQEQPVLDGIDAEIVQFWSGRVQMTAVLDDLRNVLEVYWLDSDRSIKESRTLLDHPCFGVLCGLCHRRMLVLP